MEAYAGRTDMILLFDYYNTYSADLLFSFREAGYNGPAVVIEDDGFLPEGVISVYGFFMGDFSKSGSNPGRPRYFNEILVPEYWEITGTNSSGKIQDLYRERGRIFYAEPKQKRLVNTVDWPDERGVVRSSDHYNRFGALCGRTVFNAKGQKVNRTHFSPEGREVIVENFVTGDILLNEGEEIHFFRSKTELVLYFLKAAGLLGRRLFFNSLSTPFFVSQRLAPQEKGDVLFWQEPVWDSIPGNMQIILEGRATRTQQIFVQLPKSYTRLLELGADENWVHRLGFFFDFRRENAHRPEALICTNSDNIEHCREVVEAVPEVHFHIAAITEMSAKLMSMGDYSNVSLYPGIKEKLLEELFEECDFYLDINHGGEIVSAVRRAFLQNQLILAFRETLHNGNYVSEEHIYEAEEYQQLCENLKQLVSDGEKMEKALELQRTAAFAENIEKYKKLL